MLEFGLRRGISVPINWDQRNADARYLLQLKKQSQQEQEAKAKLFADDADYTNAVNTYDNPIIKEKMKGKVYEIGKWAQQNPGWERDVQKRLEYKGLIKDLKDDPDLIRGLASDKGIADFNKYASDPKNADLVGTPEFEHEKQRLSNYLKYGNDKGVAGERNAYTFIAPEEGKDTTSALVDLASKAEFDVKDRVGKDGYKQSISDVRKNQAVEHALASTWGPYLKKDYNKYQSQLVGNDKSNAKTLNEFVKERMSPYFKSDKIEIGHDYAPIKAASTATMTPSLWNEMHIKAIKNPGQKIDLGAEALQQTFGNKAGEVNLDSVKDPFGNELNLGMRRAAFTGLVTPQKSPDGSMYSEADAMVRLPVDEFEALGEDYNKIIDERGLGQFTPGASKTWDITEGGQKLGFKKYVDEKGTPYVEFVAHKKYDPANPNLADNYANAHNISQHKENPYEGTTESTQGTEQPILSGSGKYVWDGQKWIPNK